MSNQMNGNPMLNGVQPHPQSQPITHMMGNLTINQNLGMQQQQQHAILHQNDANQNIPVYQQQR